MSLRTRIALLVGITVLLASAIGGIGTAISSRTVGINRLDQALLADANVIDVRNPRLAAQLQFSFEARRAACDETEDAEGSSEESTDDDTQSQVDTTQDSGGAGPARPGRGGRLRLLPEFASTVQLVRANGGSLAACRPLPIDAADREIASAGEGTRFRSVTIDDERFRVFTQGFDGIGAVQFARSLEITNDTLRGLVLRSVGFGLLGALFASALGWLFASRITEPVRRLSETAERVAQTQDLGERIDLEGGDELGALADSFNTMLSTLDTSREQQKRLVQDASHELRTPLTSIRTNVELLQRHPDIDAEVRSEVLADIGVELNELTELTGELVESATQVPASIELTDELNLLALATSCADTAQRRYPRVVAVSGDAEAASATVLGDSGLLTRAITNLVNNAVKFSDGDIEIVVSGTRLVVRDEGPGIASADLTNIFDRFYRATIDRSAPGSGLGLAIVKQIVEGHGGSVHAANRQGPGAEIGFELPAVLSADID